MEARTEASLTVMPTKQEIKKPNTLFLDDFSQELWYTTYKNYSDLDVNDSHVRTAKWLASPEKDQVYWTNRFLQILENFRFVPGGRISSNAGTGLKGTTAINCFVDGFTSETGELGFEAIKKIRAQLALGPVGPAMELYLSTLQNIVQGTVTPGQDSMTGIMHALHRQSLILKSEGGYGFCADVLRPRGAFIEGVGVEGPGAVKMIQMWDKSSEVITAGSGQKKKTEKGKNKIRKGAMMVTMSIWNPSIVEFITAKQIPGQLTKFNMSVLVTDDFMKAVDAHAAWNLEFPETSHERYDAEWDGNIRSWKAKGYPTKVWKTYEDANELWDLIMQSTYSRNEPGVLFIDVINRLNNLYYCEYINATNPCGEQVLPIGGVCLLGSMNLTQYVDLKKGDWDYEKLSQDIPVFVRALDNVNDVTYVPLAAQKENLKNKRRIGLGYMGYASALFMLKVRYGSEQALKLTDKLGEFVMNKEYEASAYLAKEKGAFPLFNKELFLKGAFVKGLRPEVLELISREGLRNSHLGSIQPTGNSSIYANNVSGGLEPVFEPEYIRTSIQAHPPDGMAMPIVDWTNRTWKYDGTAPSITATEWDWAKEGDEYLLVAKFNGDVYKFDQSRGLLRETKVKDYAVRLLEKTGEWDAKADWAAPASKLSIDDHVKTMKVFAKYIDSAMSKTVNLPENYSYDDFKRLYHDVYKTGIIKGCTTYRTGTMASVLQATSTQAEKKSKGGIVHSQAPKRPERLPCHVHHVTADGIKWVVLVGLYVDGIEEKKTEELFTMNLGRC